MKQVKKMKQTKEIEQEKKQWPLVAIILLNWNGGKVIARCLESLKRTTYPNYKVILVDNGSEDDSVEQLKKIRPDMDIVYLAKNYGYPIGMNRGWKYALEKYNPDYICDLSSDVFTIQDDWLEVQIKELEKHEDWGISSGKFIFEDGGLQIVNDNSERGIFEQDHGQYDYIKEMSYIRAPCPIIKRAVIDKIKGLDEHYFYGPDDIDMCLRTREAGYKIIFNGFAKSIHLAGHAGLSHKRDSIFGPQVEGMLICWFRHPELGGDGRLGGGFKMAIRQFARVFVTRKNPFAPKSPGNLYFNITFPKRLFSYFKALFNALRKYKYVLLNTPVQQIIKKHGIKVENETKPDYGT